MLNVQDGCQKISNYQFKAYLRRSYLSIYFICTKSRQEALSLIPNLNMQSAGLSLMLSDST
jgi:hypothetical protein